MQLPLVAVAQATLKAIILFSEIVLLQILSIHMLLVVAEEVAVALEEMVGQAAVVAEIFQQVLLLEVLVHQVKEIMAAAETNLLAAAVAEVVIQVLQVVVAEQVV